MENDYSENVQGEGTPVSGWKVPLVVSSQLKTVAAQRQPLVWTRTLREVAGDIVTILGIESSQPLIAMMHACRMAVGLRDVGDLLQNMGAFALLLDVEWIADSHQPSKCTGDCGQPRRESNANPQTPSATGKVEDGSVVWEQEASLQETVDDLLQGANLQETVGDLRNECEEEEEEFLKSIDDILESFEKSGDVVVVDGSSAEVPCNTEVEKTVAKDIFAHLAAFSPSEVLAETGITSRKLCPGLLTQSVDGDDGERVEDEEVDCVVPPDGLEHVQSKVELIGRLDQDDLSSSEQKAGVGVDVRNADVPGNTEVEKTVAKDIFAHLATSSPSGVPAVVGIALELCPGLSTKQKCEGEGVGEGDDVDRVVPPDGQEKKVQSAGYYCIVGENESDVRFDQGVLSKVDNEVQPPGLTHASDDGETEQQAAQVVRTKAWYWEISPEARRRTVWVADKRRTDAIVFNSPLVALKRMEAEAQRQAASKKRREISSPEPSFELCILVKLRRASKRFGERMSGIDGG